MGGGGLLWPVSVVRIWRRGSPHETARQSHNPSLSCAPQDHTQKRNYQTRPRCNDKEQWQPHTTRHHTMRLLGTDRQQEENSREDDKNNARQNSKSYLTTKNNDGSFRPEERYNGRTFLPFSREFFSSTRAFYPWKLRGTRWGKWEESRNRWHQPLLRSRLNDRSKASAVTVDVQWRLSGQTYCRQLDCYCACKMFPVINLSAYMPLTN